MVVFALFSLLVLFFFTRVDLFLYYKNSPNAKGKKRERWLGGAENK